MLKNASQLTASIDNVTSTKRFVASYTKIGTYPFAYVQFIVSFYQEIALSFISFSFVFSVLTIAYFVIPPYFVMNKILVGFSFFSFYVYSRIFYQTAKIWSKTSNE